MTIQTRSANGIVLSLYSTDYSLILFLNDGKLQLTYHQSNNQSTTSDGLFDETRWIDNGDEYTIILSANTSAILSSKYQIPILIPWNLSSFEILIVGGAFHSSNDQLLACFSNITYNSRSIIPTGMIKSSRYQCVYDDQTICDQSLACPRNQSLDFCGENDCSLVCISSSSNRSLIEYSSEIDDGENEQIFLTIFTTSSNSTLFIATNGSIEVSIILQVNYHRLRPVSHACL